MNIKRIAILLAMIFFAEKVYADCQWEGDWLVCKSADGIDKISKTEYVSPGVYRIWIETKAETRETTLYTEVNCSTKTFRHLQANFYNKYGDYDIAKKQERDAISTLYYIKPDTIYSKVCELAQK